MKSVRRKKRQSKKQWLGYFYSGIKPIATQLIIRVSACRETPTIPSPHMSVINQIASIEGRGELYHDSSRTSYRYVHSVSLPQIEAPNIFLGGSHLRQGTFRTSHTEQSMSIISLCQKTFSLIADCVDKAFPYFEEERIHYSLPKRSPCLQVKTTTPSSLIYRFMQVEPAIPHYFLFAREMRSLVPR